MSEEFSPKEQIAHSLGLWWLIALAMIMGGLIGYGFHRSHPPIYQAKAVISTFIDYQDITDVKLTEFDEDITINSIENVMLSNDVIRSLILAAGKAGISLDYTAFMDNMSIHRKLADFDIFYRDRDPVVAQQVVNLWVQIGVDAIHQMQAAGKLPVYLTVNLSSTAELPQAPYFPQTNSYVLAGILLGFIAGILFSVLIPPGRKIRIKRSPHKDSRQA